MSDPSADSERTWDVTINGEYHYVFKAKTAAGACMAAGLRYRRDHTGGQEVGEIESIEAHLRRTHIDSSGSEVEDNG